MGTFKNVRATFEWSPAIVLFGRNDAGKSNTLEAIEACLCGESDDRRVVRTSLRDRDMPAPHAGAAVLVELTAASAGVASADDLLSELIQRRPPRIAFDELHFMRLLIDPDLAEPNSIMIGGDEVMALGDVQEELPLLLERLKKGLMDFGRARCSNWQAVAGAFEELLDLCLASRLVAVATDSDPRVVHWMGLAPGARPERFLEAARTLDANRTFWADDYIPVLNDIVRSVISESDPGIFIYDLTELATFRPFRAAHIGTIGGGLEELASELKTRIEALFKALLEQAAGYAERELRESRYFKFEALHSSDDNWLEEVDGGFVRVHPIVQALCASVSARATELAPRFIRERYRIVIEAVSPVSWPRNGRRLAVCVERLDDDRRYEITVVGSGTAVWAGYSAIEAARRLERDIEALADLPPTASFEQAVERLIGDIELFPSLESAAERRISAETNMEGAGAFGIRQLIPEVAKSKDRRVIFVEPETLYIFDEPERHLHPSAQRQVAEWIASLAEAGAFVLVATHAAPFLRLPLESAEYVLVYEGSDGMSRTDPITRDVLGALTARADRAGLSPAELIQLTQAFLIVEGRHDEQVIDHFYGDDLRKARIAILPLRGTTRTKLLAEAEFLRRLRIPIFILFDRTSREDSQESQAISSLLKHWPDDEAPPVKIEFEPPDIFFALPEDHVRRVLKTKFGVSFPGFASIEREAGAKSAKSFLFERLRLPSDQDRVLAEILAECPRTHPVGTPLDRAMHELLAHAGD